MTDTETRDYEYLLGLYEELRNKYDTLMGEVAALSHDLDVFKRKESEGATAHTPTQAKINPRTSAPRFRVGGISQNPDVAERLVIILTLLWNTSHLTFAQLQSSMPDTGPNELQYALRLLVKAGRIRPRNRNTTPWEYLIIRGAR